MKYKILAAVLVLGSTILAGCSGGYYSGGSYIRYGPPAPRYGVMGRAPGPGYVWTDGHYAWSGNNYRWNDGRWMRPPRGRSVYVAPTWQQNRGGWRMSGGYWR